MPLPPSAGVGDWVHDFVHSDNSRFKGKSKQSRIRMALGAYYAKKKSHSIKEDETPNVDRTDKASKLGTYTLPKLRMATPIDPASPPGTTSVVNKGTIPNSLGSSFMASKESGKKKLKEGSDGGFSGAEPLIGEDGKKIKKKKNIKEQNFDSKTNLPDFSGLRKFREANPSGLLTMGKINNMLSSSPPSSSGTPTINPSTSAPTSSSTPSSSGVPTSQESGKKKKLKEESPEDPMTVAGTKGAPNPNASRMQITNLESGKKKSLRKTIIPDKYTNYGGRDTGMSI
jgi:hypothetical protein